VGKITIGVGRNLSDNGITSEECRAMLDRDISMAVDGVGSLFPDIDTWSPARRDALTDMMFNTGITRFSGFKKMIGAIKTGAWIAASREMLDSLWARQVGDRAIELAKMVETGEYGN